MTFGRHLFGSHNPRTSGLSRIKFSFKIRMRHRNFGRLAAGHGVGLSSRRSWCCGLQSALRSVEPRKKCANNCLARFGPTRLSVHQKFAAKCKPGRSPAVLGAASDLIAGIAPPIEKGENRLGRPTSSPLGFSGCRIPFYDPGWSRLEVNADHSTNRRRPIRTRLRR